MMNKKICSLLLACGMLGTMLLSGNVYAADELNCSIGNSTKSVDISNLQSYYTKDVVNVSFGLTNLGILDENIDVDIAVLDSNNIKKAGTVLQMDLKSGKTLPVRFSGSVPTEDKYTVDVRIRSYDEDVTLYLSPNGNDVNDGSEDAPLKTLRAVAQRLTYINMNNSKDNLNVRVILKGGTYAVDDTVKMNDLNNIVNVEFVSYQGAVINGGATFKGSDMTLVSGNEKSMFPASSAEKIYCVGLSSIGAAAKNDAQLNILSCNGNFQTVARYPDTGYTYDAVTSWNNKNISITANSVKNWKYYDSAWIAGPLVAEWSFAKAKVNTIDPAAKRIDTTNFIAGYYHEDSQSNIGWYIYNLPEELDKPGEYAIYNGKLYYYPPQNLVSSGEFKKAKLMLSSTNNDVIDITNSSNITFKNISFENAGGYFINAQNSDNIKLQGCTFKLCAKNAVNVSGNNNLITDCKFNKSGQRAVTIGGGDRNTLTASNSVIENCTISETGCTSITDSPAITVTGCGTAARHNTITKTPHLAIAFNGNDCVIEYNDISNCLTEGISDAGIIYSGNSLANLGNEIRYNYIHDTNCGLGAVYLDDFLSGQKIYSNVFENVKNAYFVHGGVWNKFENNLVVNADKGVFVRGKGDYQQWNTTPTPTAASNNFMYQLLKFPYQSESWQNKYGHVLAYVNNRSNGLPEHSVVNGNCFINVATPVSALSDNDAKGLEVGEIYTSISDVQKQEYDAIKQQCGAKQ
ncbi:MAG: right-handed parallel beta-helix repeat-containing protein [Clostridia bacterium]|nr:right-handed parallel beta-helix repeat-containing protein [Clostridia bacterium]